MSRKLSSYYSKKETKALAYALSSTIFTCLVNAENRPEEQEKWFSQADKLERKFTTDFGKHYSYYLE